MRRTQLQNLYFLLCGFRWSRGSVLAFGIHVPGFKPGRSRQIFKGEKILSTPSFGGEVKPSVPCRMLKTHGNYMEVEFFRQNLSAISRPFLFLTTGALMSLDVERLWG